MLIKKLMARVYRNDEPSDDGGGYAVAEDGGTIGTGNDARLALMNQINDANDGMRAEEMAEINDDGSTTQFAVDATTQAELDRFADEANGSVDEDSGSIVSNDGIAEQVTPRHKIKVNGRELELTTDELIARAQKVEAADQYIAEAARIKREAEQYQNTQPPVATPKGPTEAELLEERRALVRAIQMGTEEEAMYALEKLQQPTRPALSADDLARTVDERLTFKEAINRFETEFQDVLSDPVLKQLALQQDQALLAQGDKRGYWERYEAIGSNLRTWKQSLVPKVDPVAAQQTVLAGKAQRKAAAPGVPTAASARAPAARRDDEGDESVGDVIASIAKARGGPQWMRS